MCPRKQDLYDWPTKDTSRQNTFSHTYTNIHEQWFKDPLTDIAHVTVFYLHSLRLRNPGADA